jgi:hypothetical protein
MIILHGLLAAFAALACLCLSGTAEANGRAGPAVQSFAAPVWHRGAAVVGARYAWRSGSDLVNEAARYVGSGKFTALPGAWCADAVNVWLRAIGKPPLASRMAGAALSYGPRGSGAPGDLAVFMGRRGYAYHVGVVVADLGSEVEIVSGNWSHRVARAVLSRRGLVFVRT